MSKMGQDFLDMQEDAINMTKEEFVKKYGVINADLYDQILDQNTPDWMLLALSKIPLIRSF